MDEAARTETAPAEVPRRRNLPYAEFERDYLAPNKPVILTGCMEHWTALSKWSPDFFKREYGAAPVAVEGRKLPLGAFVDLALASSPERPAPCLQDAPLREIAPELMKDIEPFAEYCFPNWLPGAYLIEKFRDLFNAAQIELFLGGEGARSDGIFYAYIHAHTAHCQVFGRREFALFPPEDAPRLYASGHASAIADPRTVDLERFPLFAHATPITFMLEPGEILFLPGGWWQASRLPTASISVGVNFANASNWAAVTRELCATSVARLPVIRTLVSAYLAALGRSKQSRGRWPAPPSSASSRRVPSRKPAPRVDARRKPAPSRVCDACDSFASIFSSREKKK